MNPGKAPPFFYLVVLRVLGLGALGIGFILLILWLVIGWHEGNIGGEYRSNGLLL